MWTPAGCVEPQCNLLLTLCHAAVNSTGLVIYSLTLRCSAVSTVGKT